MPKQNTFTFPFVHYPIIPVQFEHNNKKTPFIVALIDSGGDSVVVPKAIVDFLGARIEEADVAKTAGGDTKIQKTKLKLTIGKEEPRITYEDIDIFVVNSSDVPVLLGRTPLFDDFEITFRKKKGEIILKKA
ncbi:MAG TPA: aspartyl protease [Thermoplasmatales archaeon]|nr:aspartyl protease [Thermoplasmatales archaeon]